MNKLICILSIAFVFSACFYDTERYFESLPKPIPSQKEINFIKKIERQGYKNVKLNIPRIGEIAYGTQVYSVEMDAYFSISKNNIDSIGIVRLKIANELYNLVVADSILFDCKKIDVRVNYPESGFNPYKYSQLTDPFSKDSLEKWCGFKVVKIGKDKFKRVKV